MKQNIIYDTIKQNINDENAIFVFSVQMAADKWSDRIIETNVAKAVALERFIAWDTFKGESIRSQNQTKNAIPSVMRKIFASMIIQENAKKPFLKSIIVPEYAKNSNGFENWIASLLPSLALWKKHFDSALKSASETPYFDDEDKDLYLLYTKYKDFLLAHNFFDPAWETPPFINDDKHYFIFFPEILSDYTEYKKILEESSENITVIHLNEFSKTDDTKDAPPVDFFSDSRTEIKNLALYIKRIHEKDGVAWNEIAVNVPDMESYGVYIERELAINEIPHITRFAKPLGKMDAGTFFLQIDDCVTQNFSYESVKTLLLNKTLPWTNDASVASEQLLQFGRDNNCFCSYANNGEQIDVWEKSFKTRLLDERASIFYEKLKFAAKKLVSSTSFQKIREHYFQFRSSFWDMSICTEESNNIISRCITSLGELIDIEESYPDCTVKNCYKFFENYLNQKEYLSKTKQDGVHIIPYKTACEVPFACQIIVDSSQTSLSVLYKQLAFLCENKRKNIFHLEDEDVSKYFIALYDMNSIADANSILHYTYFSASKKTFTGYAQVSSYLKENVIKSGTASYLFAIADSFTEEKNWYLTKVLPHVKQTKKKEIFELDTDDPYEKSQSCNETSSDDENTKVQSEKSDDTTETSWDGAEDAAFPEAISETQKRGFDFWCSLQTVDETGVTLSPLLEKIKANRYTKSENSMQKIRISETHLKNFFDCPLFYLQNYIMDIKAQSTDATLIDQFAVGQLNHKILEFYFLTLKSKNISLYKMQNDALDDVCKKILEESIEKAIQAEKSKAHGNSFLANELIKTAKTTLMHEIENALVAFSANFAGCKIYDIERKCVYDAPDKNYVCEGKIDCLLYDESADEFILIDFKSSDYSVPKKNFYYVPENKIEGEESKTSDIIDFQMPMYIFLLQNENPAIKIENCGFFTLKRYSQHDYFYPVIGKNVFARDLEYRRLEKPGAKPKTVVTFAEFSATMNKFYEYLDVFAKRITEMDFSVAKENQTFEKCSACAYAAVCRNNFVVSGK